MSATLVCNHSAAVPDLLSGAIGRVVSVRHHGQIYLGQLTTVSGDAFIIDTGQTNLVFDVGNDDLRIHVGTRLTASPSGSGKKPLVRVI